MKTLLTQVRATLADTEFELAQTRKGTEYRIYNITDNDDFWELWKANKEAVKALGFVAFKKDRYSSEYYLRDMSALEYDCSKKASKARSLENLEKAREVKKANDDARKAIKTKAKRKATKVATSLDEVTNLELIKVLADRLGYAVVAK